MMKTISRRTALKLFTSAPVAAAAAISWTPLEAERAQEKAQAAAKNTARTGAPFKPKFFTAHEYATVVALVDLIIPCDERSCSASAAGVPQFMDFMMIDRPNRQVAMRGGLAMIDHICDERFDKTFLAASEDQRKQVLDDIAFPNAVKPELKQAASFFSTFRDLAASGFWTTKEGIADLGYKGNAFVAKWNGCPDDALKKLGVSYGPEHG
jgi:hypothetical protein